VGHASVDELSARFAANPSDRVAFEALEEAHFVAGRWPALVELYSQRLLAPELDGARHAGARSRLLLRLAQVLEERCDRVDDAVARYEEAFRLDASLRPALTQLRRIHARRDHWDLALQVAELEAALPMRPFERAAFATEIGELWLRRLNDPAQAAASFQQACAADPHHAPAQLGLAAAHEALGHHADAATALGRAIDVLKGTERARALVRLARIVEGSLGNARRAHELYRRAYTDDARNVEALDALARLAETNEQWELLEDLHERRFALEPNPIRKLAIAHDAGRIQLEKLRNPQGARHWFRRALELFPDDPVVHLHLADVARLSGNTDELAEHLRRAATLAADATPVAVLRESAKLAGAAGDHERAIADLERAVRSKPDRAELAHELATALWRAGRFDDLVELLERSIGQAPSGSAEQAALWLALANAHEEGTQDLPAAVQALEQAAAIVPGDSRVAAGLDRLLRKSERWEDLRAHLAGLAATADPVAAVSIHCQRGALEIDHFEDLEAARACFEAALSLDADCLVARQGLERIALALGDDDTILEAFEREAETATDRDRLAFLVGELARIHEEQQRPERALHWLEHLAHAVPDDVPVLESCARLQEALGRSEALCRTLEAIDRRIDGAPRAALRRRLGAVRAARGEVDHALAAYEGALTAAPGDLESARACVALLANAGRPAELATARRRLAELATGSERVAELYALGVLLAGAPGDLPAGAQRDLPGAAACFEAVVDEPEAPADSEDRLLACLEALERFEPLCTRLERRRARLDPLSPDAFALDLRRAELLLDGLDRPDAAIPLLDLVREALPDHEGARAALERALRRTDNAARLAPLLAETASRESDPERRARLDFERAGLLLEPLRALAEARALLAELAAGGSSVAHAAETRLMTLLEQERDWPALAAALEARIERRPDAETAELRQRLAFLCRDRMNDPAAAARHLEAAVALEPGRVDWIQSLALLYQTLDRPEDQLRVLELELPHADPERARLLHHRFAEIAASRLADPARAERHWKALLALDPTSVPALEFLTRRLEDEQRHAELAEVLRARLAQLGDDAGAATSLRLRIAGLEAGPLADPETAAATLAPAAADELTLPVVAEPLADLYQRLGRHDELIALARRAAAASSLPAERAGWRLRIGDALRKAGDLGGAAEAVRQGLADRPDDPAAQAVLRDLYRQLGEFAPLALLLEAQVARAAGSGEAPIRLELAALFEGPLARPADALRHLRRVLEIAPGHAEALTRACALAEQLNDAEALESLLADAATRAATSRERAELLTRRAGVLVDALGRRDDALACYDEALRLDSRSEAALAGLRAALAARGDWRGVLASIERGVARLAPEAREQRVALLREGAALAAERLDADAVLPWLERLRHCQPEDPEVLGRLAALHREAGRHSALREVLDTRLALARSGAERAKLQLERARLLSRELAAPESALAALEDARAAAPDDPAVLEALEALYAAQQRHAEQLTILETRLRLAEPAQRVGLHVKAAALARGLGRELEAAGQLEAALALPAPSSMERAETLRELASVWRSLGRVDRAVAASEAELASLDPEAPVFAERRRALRFDLARACAEELGRIDAAIAHLRALFDREQESGERLEHAELLLLTLLRRADDSVELERRLAARLARRAETKDADGWLELARLRRERLQRPAAAATSYREALARDSERLEALRGLRACAELLGDFEEVARTLENELALRPDAPPTERSALLRRLGGVTWHELDHTARARTAFAAALEADPNDLVALRSLEALSEGMEDWRGAADLFEREIQALGEREPERRRAAWLRIGELSHERASDFERAIRAFAAADALAPLAPGHIRGWALCHERVGNREAFAWLFGRWMDAPGAAACVADRIRLADTLADLGRPNEALAHALQAVELDAQLGEAWDRVASLHETLGRPADAAEALVRSALCTGGREAAVRRLGAAELVESESPERAATWFGEAVADDPALAPAHARLAIVSARLGRLSVAERAAERALALPGSDEGALSPALRLETALVGARAARAQDHREAAAGMFAAVLALDADQAEALAGLGELRLALGDAAGARDALVRRLARPASDADRAVQLALLGQANEKLGDTEAALQHYREALGLDPSREPAHAGLARLLVREGRSAEAIGALTAWAGLASDGESRAARLLQAAELELARPGRSEAAEPLLRDAVAAWPQAPGAFGTLTELLWSQGRAADVIALAPQALASAPSALERSRVALAAARALEQRGSGREAAEHYRVACTENPRASEAALSAARLLRGLGEWRPAADVLSAFLAAAPADAGALTAAVQHQLGRLLAGPLESLDGALAAYRAALEADPQLTEAREALADLLVHRPELWDEAIARHRELLALNPVRVASLRGLLRIARARGNDVAVATALALLRALGLATPAERQEAAARLPIPLDKKPRFANPVWETARALAQEAAEEIGQALGVGTSAPGDPRGLADPVARFRAEVTAAEAALSAPALLPLSLEELGETITLVAQLTAEVDAVSGDGRIVNALAQALGRRARKRLKRVLGETPAHEIAAIDFAAWRAELRGLASFAALASGGAELRTAFLAWVAADDPEGARLLTAEGDVCPRVAVIPEARALLARLIDAWIPHV
jgi:tetratricopeptide (TPR) repeat protein